MDEILERVKKCISDVIGSGEVIFLETSLADDLGVDSLEAIEVIMAIEDEFSILVPDELYPKLKTVGDLVKYIQAEVK